MKITKGLHPSKKMLGYFYKKEKGFYIACIGILELQKYTNIEDCIESFKNRQ